MSQARPHTAHILTTTDGASTSLDDEKIKGFRSTLRGDLIMNDHPAYESARRVWNGNIDRRPALIARCAGVADVQRAVTFARMHSLRLSIRDGGHSAPGHGTNDGGLVIDQQQSRVLDGQFIWIVGHGYFLFLIASLLRTWHKRQVYCAALRGEIGVTFQRM